MNFRPSKNSLNSIHKAQSDEKLGSVLEKASNSHDPIFVFKDENFIGITSPYYAIFKKRYPYTTKVSHTVIMPPRLSYNSDVYEIATHMLSTKIYSLPLYKNGELSSLAKATDILKEMVKNNVLNHNHITPHTPITISHQAKVKDALAKLKKENISRLVVIDEKGQLQGIVSRRDLQEAFTTPSRKLRFGKNNNGGRSWSFDDEKIKRGDYPLREFMRIDTATVEEGTDIKSAIQQMLNKRVGSVIFVNKNYEPVGLVSTHTFLAYLADLKPQAYEANIIITDKHGLISQSQRTRITQKLQQLAKKLNKKSRLQFIEATIDADRNSAEKIKSFEASLLVHLEKQNNLVAKVLGKTLTQAINESVKKIEHQVKDFSH